MDKAFYMIEFKAGACLFDIKLNDVSVFSLNMDKFISMTLPVNNLILESGVQQLSATVLPLLGEIALDDNVSFGMTVKLHNDTGTSLQHVEDILTYTIPENTKENPLPVVEYHTTFNASVPYKITAWQNSVDLRDFPDLRNMLDRICKTIEHLVNTKQYDRFVDMLSEREDNVSIAMYFTPEEKKGRMQRLVDDFKSGFTMVPFSLDEAIIVYYAQGKVITLVKSDLESAFRFVNTETGEELNLEMRFHLKRGSTELSII